MRRFFSFLAPEEASNLSHEVDAIFYSLLALCSAMALLVIALIIYFCIRYRRGSSAPRQPQPREGLGSWSLETAWTLFPLPFFLAVFAWAAAAFFRMSKPPADATEIYVVGKQWMWKLQHTDGRREINELHLPAGRAVKLIMTSQDVIHDFFVPAFRTKQDVLPGRYTTEWFTPTRPGKYHLFCAQYCGTYHSGMVGWVHVLEPAEYARWLARQPAADTLAARGERVFRTYGCSGCHAPGSKIHAPLLDGVYGRPVPLSDGRVVTADDQYLRDSILLPNKDIAAGYEPLMPSFQNQIGEDDLAAVIAYLKSLSALERRTP